MRKTLRYVPEPSVKGVMQRILLDLNQSPVNMSEKPKADVPPPLPFVIDLSFHNEDMEVLKQKYKVLSSSSSVVNNDYLKNLGFQDGCETMMRIRNKKVKIPRNSNHALARSLFKEFKKDKGVDWMVSLSEPIEGKKDKDKGHKRDAHHLAAKILLKDFVLQAKDRASAIRKKGKKKVWFACGPLDGIWKKKLVSKKRSLNGIVIIDKEHDA